jgi:hypothetical protein
MSSDGKTRAAKKAGDKAEDSNGEKRKKKKSKKRVEGSAEDSNRSASSHHAVSSEKKKKKSKKGGGSEPENNGEDEQNPKQRSASRSRGSSFGGDGNGNDNRNLDANSNEEKVGGSTTENNTQLLQEKGANTEEEQDEDHDEDDSVHGSEATEGGGVDDLNGDLVDQKKEQAEKLLKSKKKKEKRKRRAEAAKLKKAQDQAKLLAKKLKESSSEEEETSESDVEAEITAAKKKVEDLEAKKASRQEKLSMKELSEFKETRMRDRQKDLLQRGGVLTQMFVDDDENWDEDHAAELEKIRKQLDAIDEQQKAMASHTKKLNAMKKAAKKREREKEHEKRNSWSSDSDQSSSSSDGSRNRRRRKRKPTEVQRAPKKPDWPIGQAPRFTADTNVAEWWQAIENKISGSELTPPFFTKYLVRITEGHVQTNINKEVLEKGLTWKEAKEWMLKEYGRADETEELEARRKLEQLKQTASVATYADLFKELKRKSNFTGDNKSECVKFINGLKPRLLEAVMTHYVAKNTVGKKKMTLQTVIELAKGLEFTYAPIAEKREKRNDEAKQTEKSDVGERVFKKKFEGKCNHCGKKGHKEIECFELHGRPEAPKERKKKHGDSKKQRSVEESVSPNDADGEKQHKRPASTLVCYNCWEKGHPSTKCANPKREQPAEYAHIKVKKREKSESNKRDDKEKPKTQAISVRVSPQLEFSPNVDGKRHDSPTGYLEAAKRGEKSATIDAEAAERPVMVLKKKRESKDDDAPRVDEEVRELSPLEKKHGEAPKMTVLMLSVRRSKSKSPERSEVGDVQEEQEEEQSSEKGEGEPSQSVDGEEVDDQIDTKAVREREKKERFLASAQDQGMAKFALQHRQSVEEAQVLANRLSKRTTSYGYTSDELVFFSETLCSIGSKLNANEKGLLKMRDALAAAQREAKEKEDEKDFREWEANDLQKREELLEENKNNQDSLFREQAAGKRKREEGPVEVERKKSKQSKTKHEDFETMSQSSETKRKIVTNPMNVRVSAPDLSSSSSSSSSTRQYYEDMKISIGGRSEESPRRKISPSQEKRRRRRKSKSRSYSRESSPRRQTKSKKKSETPKRQFESREKSESGSRKKEQKSEKKDREKDYPLAKDEGGDLPDHVTPSNRKSLWNPHKIREAYQEEIVLSDVDWDHNGSHRQFKEVTTNYLVSDWIEMRKRGCTALEKTDEDVEKFIEEKLSAMEEMWREDQRKEMQAVKELAYDNADRSTRAKGYDFAFARDWNKHSQLWNLAFAARTALKLGRDIKAFNPLSFSACKPPDNYKFAWQYHCVMTTNESNAHMKRENALKSRVWIGKKKAEALEKKFGNYSQEEIEANCEAAKKEFEECGKQFFILMRDRKREEKEKQGRREEESRQPPRNRNSHQARVITSKSQAAALATTAEAKWRDDFTKKAENRLGKKVLVQCGIVLKETKQGFEVMQDWAVIDSGSDVTLINDSFAKKLGLTFVPRSELPERDRLDIGTVTDATISYSGCVYPNAQIGKRRAVVRMFVVNFLEHSILLGTDTMSIFGLGISGIPLKTPLEYLREQFTDTDEDISLPSAKDEWFRKVKQSKRLSGRERELFDSLVRPAFERNAALPSNTFCNLPESIVSIPTGDAEPIYIKQYPIEYGLQKEFIEHAQELRREGITRDADFNTGWNFAMFPIRQGKKIRWVVDLKPLNQKITVPLWATPSVDEILKLAACFVLCSKLDLKRGYYQFRIRPEDQHKLTFTCNGRRYSFCRAAFGLKHLPCIFQSAIELMLRKLPETVKAGNYLDDILVFTVRLSWDEPREQIIRRHAEDTASVVDLLTETSLLLNKDKCNLALEEVNLLGLLCSDGKMSPDPEKIESLSKFPVPKTGKQVQGFLGTVNYSRRFMPLYSTLLAPIEALRNVKKIGDQWTERCQIAFEKVIEILIRAPVICAPDWNREFCVATDASNVGIAAICFQGDYFDPDSLKLVAIANRALHISEKNYSTPQKELLGIVFALQKFREYLYGRRFKLYTDHRAHCFLLTKRGCTELIARWWLVILQFDMEIIHCPGVKNVIPDALSRVFPDFVWERGESGSNSPHFVERKSSERKLVDRLRVTAREDMGDKAESVHQKRIVAPEDVQKELERVHVEGHYGAEHLVNSLWDQGLYWETMLKDAKEFVKKCMQCLRFNVMKKGFNPQKSILATYPLDHLAIDLFSLNQTTSRGINFVLVVVDVATRFAFLEPLPDKEMTTVAWALWKLWCRSGFPKIVQHDNGKEFVNRVLDSLTTEIGVDQRCISAYYPQGNGLAEAHVKIAREALTKMSEGNIANFDRYLPAVERAINMRWSSDTSSRPFELFYARPTNYLHEYREVDSKLKTEAEILEHNNQMVDFIFTTVAERVAGRRKDRDEKATKKRGKAKEFGVGDKVMTLDTVRGPKHEARMLGPFWIAEVLKGGSIKLREGLPDLTILPRVFPVSHLKLIEKKPEFDEAPEFIVKEILDVKGPEGKRKYLVRWKHYTEEHNSWEPTSMFSSDEVIKRFWKERTEAEKKGAVFPPIDVSEKDDEENDEKKADEPAVVVEEEWIPEAIVNYRVVKGKKNPQRQYQVKWKNEPNKKWTIADHCETDAGLKLCVESYREKNKEKCLKLDVLFVGLKAKTLARSVADQEGAVHDGGG